MCHNIINNIYNNTNPSMSNHFDYEDVYRVVCDITLVNDEHESRIEKRMQQECRDGTYYDFGLASYFKLNLKNSSGISSVQHFLRTHRSGVLDIGKSHSGQIRQKRMLAKMWTFQQKAQILYGPAPITVFI